MREEQGMMGESGIMEEKRDAGMEDLGMETKSVDERRF